jgi:hypothetical protein
MNRAGRLILTLTVPPASRHIHAGKPPDATHPLFGRVGCSAAPVEAGWSVPPPEVFEQIEL